MNKFKILILGIILILLTGCGKDKQLELIDKYNITEEGFTCSYVVQTQSYIDWKYEVHSVPEITESSKFSIQVRKQRPGESDYDEENPLVVRFNVDNAGFKRVALENNMEIELNAYGKTFPFTVSTSLLEEILEYYSKYGICMDNIIACRDTDLEEHSHIDIVHDDYTIYPINSKSNFCIYQVSFRHDESKNDEKSIRYSEMEESKSYCVLTTRKDSYSSINLYRNKDENYFRFDVAVDSTCKEDPNNLWKGQLYPIEKGETFTTPPYTFPPHLAKFSFLTPHYTVTIPEDQIPLLFPEGGGFPKQIYVCELDIGIFQGGHDMKIYVNKPDADKGDCQKTRDWSVVLEEGYASGRAGKYQAEPDCEGIFGGLGDELQSIFNVIKIAAPILILVLSIIDFVRATIQQDKDEMKVAFNKLIKRLILAVILFLLPIILGIVLQWSGSTLDDPLCSIR